MAGIKLRPEDGARQARVARDLGQPKSALARDWILARIEREDIDTKIRHAAALDICENRDCAKIAGDASADLILRWLDAEDRGFDWGANGPSVAK